MASTFTKKQLQFQFTLATGNFDVGAGPAGNSASVQGVWAHCDIDVVGDDHSGTMAAAIYGLPLSMMNQLSVIGGVYGQTGANTITVMAGDETTGMSLVFTGTIFYCFPDGSNQPNIPLRVHATSTGFQRVKPAPSTTKAGSADVAGMLGNLASQMGLSFENNGVVATLANPYFWGSAAIQVAKIAEAANIYHLIDKGVLAIWPQNGARSGNIMVSPQTGMVGYPRFDSAKVVVDKYFDPTINCGQNMTVQSQFIAACGTWNIIHIHESLDTQPHGPWFMTLEGVKV